MSKNQRLMTPPINPAYWEVADFIASLSPERVAEFQVSAAAKNRVRDLLDRNRTGSLTADEERELDHFGEVEHIMRLAKARALQYAQG
jgi:hypothetical protein